VLKTTSPTFVPSAPKAFPCHTDPSSKTNLQGFCTSHGFEIAKHFTAPPLLLDDDDENKAAEEEEEEVEHEALFFRDVLPTRPLNWCRVSVACVCAQEDDICFFFLNTRKCALVCVREELFKTEEKVLASKKLFPSLSYDETVLPRLSLSLFLFFFFRDASLPALVLSRLKLLTRRDSLFVSFFFCV